MTATRVRVLRGKNARRVGTMPGTWADRVATAKRLAAHHYGHVMIGVTFAGADHPREFVMLRLSNLCEVAGADLFT